MSVQIKTTKEVICSTCRIRIESVIAYKLHLSTEYHVYNTKRRVADLEPITEEIFDQKKSGKFTNNNSDIYNIALASLSNSNLTETLYWKCVPCKKTYGTMEQLDSHKKAKNHKKNEKLYLEQNKEKEQS
jgi:hypothetical protein